MGLWVLRTGISGHNCSMLHVWYIYLENWVILCGQMLLNIPYMEHMGGAFPWQTVRFPGYLFTMTWCLQECVLYSMGTREAVLMWTTRVITFVLHTQIIGYSTISPFATRSSSQGYCRMPRVGSVTNFLINLHVFADGCMQCMASVWD